MTSERNIVTGSKNSIRLFVLHNTVIQTCRSAELWFKGTWCVLFGPNEENLLRTWKSDTLQSIIWFCQHACTQGRREEGRRRVTPSRWAPLVLHLLEYSSVQKLRQTTFLWLWWEISDLNHHFGYNAAGNTSKTLKHDKNVCVFIKDNQDTEWITDNRTAQKGT